MEGEEERSSKEGSFSKASIPKRIAIVVAGGFVNIIFGLVVYFIIISASGDHISNTVQTTMPDYGAQIAGIQTGDQILKINGRNIRTKQDINEILDHANGQHMQVEIKRGESKQTVEVKPTEVKSKSTGIYLSGSAKNEKATQIMKIDEGSSSQKAGLEVNDVITKINGQDVIGDQNKVLKLIQSQQQENIHFTIDRNGEEKQIEVVPEEISRYYLGIEFAKAQNTFFHNLYYGFWDTKDFAFSIVDNLKSLFSGEVSADQLMGPVGISSAVASTQGIKDFVYMLALISLSLGVTNLLPFPPLDGGKVVILFIEAIRRKPLKESVEMGIQTAGFMLLIALSIFVTYHDILRIF